MAGDDDDGLSSFSVEVGQRLRAVRRLRKLSLDDVERESGGQWSASAIGAYERGFRNLSLPRLRELAEAGEIGGVSDRHWTLMGYTMRLTRLQRETIPALVGEVEKSQTDAVVLTAG